MGREGVFFRAICIFSQAQVGAERLLRGYDGGCRNERKDNLKLRPSLDLAFTITFYVKQ